MILDQPRYKVGVNSREGDRHRVVVAGGSGFLGSHVADQLSEAVHHVVIYDCRESPWLRPDQDMVVADLMDAERLHAAAAHATVVYNFAALADLNAARNQPAETVSINILGNLHVLEACSARGVQRFLYAGTVYVYSREGSFYRCSKQAAESYIEEYQRAYSPIPRFAVWGSLYGPRANASNGLYRIVRDGLMSGRVSYQGSPEAIREYIHVEDAARASVAALGSEFRNEHVVLTGLQPMRVYDLLKMLAEILGIPDRVEFRDEHPAGHYVRTPYAYRTKPGLMCVPPMHLDLGQGLLRLIEEVRSRLNDGRTAEV